MINHDTRKKKMDESLRFVHMLAKTEIRVRLVAA